MIRWGSIGLVLVLAVGSPAQNLQRGQIQPPKDIGIVDSLKGPKDAISWRASNQTASFSLVLAPRSKAVKATALVWVGGAPAEPQHLPGKTVAQKETVGKIAYTLDLGAIQGTPTFTLDFSKFAPQGKPGLITFSVNDGGTLSGASKAMAELIRKETLGYIGRTGTVTYQVQVTTADGAATNAVPVTFGELTLNHSLRPKLEYLVNAGTPEFPDKVWGSSGMIVKGTGSATLRWTPPKGTTSAIYQVGNFSDVSAWPFWNTAKTIQTGPVKLNGNGPQEFSFDVSNLKKFPDQTRFWVRVIPVADSTVLASQGSEEVVLTFSNPTVQAPAAKLEFKSELVGWAKGYEGAPDDAYRFIVWDPSWAATDELKKIIGGPVVRGAKVYLPPNPPEKELPWYKKVVNEITKVLSTIQSVMNMFVSVVATVVNILPKVPFTISTAFGVSQSNADKAYKYATAPMRLADAPLNAANRISSTPTYLASRMTDRMADDMGVKDPKVRAAMHGNIMSGISQWAKGDQFFHSSPQQLGLTLDPDFEKRTGVAFVRVTAKANGKLPDGFRSMCPTQSIEVGNLAQNQELLGTKPDYYPIYKGSTPGVMMADGESMLIPIITEYHFSKTQRPKDWNFGWVYGVKSLYNLNGKTITGTSIHDTWGKTKE